MSILALHEDVRAQIKSSVEITSLNNAIEELFKNALDAGAGNVAIEVDFAKASCSVKDDGSGIPSAEFLPTGRIAQLYCTSKQDAQSYGCHGRFLSCLSALSLVFISSHHNSENDSSTLAIKQGEVISRKTGIDNEELRSHGTIITVHNLFGGLPVRFKQNAVRFGDPIEVQRQFNHLQRLLVSYLLASGSRVNLRLRSAVCSLRYNHVSYQPTTEQRFSSDRVAGIFRQAGLSDTSICWKLASARTRNLSIRAAVSLTPLPTKQSQFISFGRYPIPEAGFGAILYESVNALFDMSAFGTIEDIEDQPFRPAATKNPDCKQSCLGSKPVKGVDRWPCFYVRIDMPSEQIAETFATRHDQDTRGSAHFQNVLALLKMLIGQFLYVNQFRPKHLRRRRPARLKPTHRTSKDAFHDWKKIKVGHNMAVDELCDGLSLSPASELDLEAEEPLSEDVRLLLQDIELSPDVIEDDAGGGSDGRPPVIKNADDGTFSWKNPRSGRLLCLDTSSGCIVCPQLTHQVHEDVSDLARPVTAGESRRRLPKSTLSSKELACRLSKWPSVGFAKNTEPAIPSLVAEHSNRLVPVESWQTIEATALATAHVLGQVDEKFILARLSTSKSETCSSLVLIDQHAADERIKVEAFYQQLCDGQRVSLGRSLIFEVSEEEAKRLEQARSFFASWALDYHTLLKEYQALDRQPLVAVTHLPYMIVERCRSEPKMVIDMLRKEIWSDNHDRSCQSNEQVKAPWIARMAHCPTSLLEMVNSRACRSAIMFNDVLTIEHCRELLRRLSQCALPFQCAHGRPSIVVLTTLGNEYVIRSTDQDQETYGNAFRHWES